MSPYNTFEYKGKFVEIWQNGVSIFVGGLNVGSAATYELSEALAKRIIDDELKTELAYLLKVRSQSKGLDAAKYNRRIKEVRGLLGSEEANS